MCTRKKKQEVSPPNGHSALLLEPELLYERTIRALVVSLEVLEVLAAISDETQKAAARVLVLRILREMSREFFDSTRQQCDLNLRRASVGIVALNLCNLVQFLPLREHGMMVAR